MVTPTMPLLQSLGGSVGQVVDTTVWFVGTLWRHEPVQGVDHYGSWGHEPVQVMVGGDTNLCRGHEPVLSRAR